MFVRSAQVTRNGHVETWYVSGDSGTDYSVHFKFHPLIGIRIWTCNCPDFTERKQWRGETCKHIDEVQYVRSTEPAFKPTPYELGQEKYGDCNWRRVISYENVTDVRARRQFFESKLEAALDAIREMLEAIRQ